MIHIVAVDDHPLILIGLESLIGKHDDMRLVATSNHGSMLLDLVSECQPDIAIVDLGMKTGMFDPIFTICAVKKQFPNTKVLVLTNYDEGIWVRALVDVGISGYMLKSDDFSEEIVRAIRALHNGGQFFSPKITALLLNNKDQIKLTDSERSILLLLAEGEPTEVIADHLGLSEKRIRNLLVTIFDKLGIERSNGISQRIMAVNKARKLGLLPDKTWDANLVSSYDNYRP